MQKNFDGTLKALDGTDMKGPDQNPVTFKTIIVNALCADAPAREPVTGEEKYKRYELASRIHKGGDIDVSPEDVVLVKKLVGNFYGPAVVGPVFDLLNG